MISDNILSLSRSFMYKIKVQKDFVSNLFFSEWRQVPWTAGLKKLSSVLPS